MLLRSPLLRQLLLPFNLLLPCRERIAKKAKRVSKLTCNSEKPCFELSWWPPFKLDQYPKEDALFLVRHGQCPTAWEEKLSDEPVSTTTDFVKGLAPFSTAEAYAWRTLARANELE